MSKPVPTYDDAFLRAVTLDVKSGRVTSEDSSAGQNVLNLVANYRLLAAAYAKTLAAAATPGDDGKVARYQEFVGIYNEFCHSQTGVAARMTVVGGAALKRIIRLLLSNKDAAASPDPTQYALDLWAAVLANWGKLSPWMQSQFALPNLEKHLPEILLKLRTHAKPSQPAQQAADSAAARALARKQQRGG